MALLFAKAKYHEEDVGCEKCGEDLLCVNGTDSGGGGCAVHLMQG